MALMSQRCLSELAGPGWDSWPLHVLCRFGLQIDRSVTSRLIGLGPLHADPSQVPMGAASPDLIIASMHTGACLDVCLATVPSQDSSLPSHP